MNLQPVIAREMRVQSRHAFSYWLRVGGTGALMLLSWFYYRGHYEDMQNGNELFLYLHRTLYWVIWLFVPFLGADCISREKREGTLGLLFLTPLTAWDIVLAKGFAQGLRALSLCLPVIPVIAIPILMGGVTFQSVLLAVLVNANAFCWAITAGMLASALGKWPFTSLLAIILSVIFHFIEVAATGIAVESTFPAAFLGRAILDSEGLFQHAAKGLFFNLGEMHRMFGRPLVRGQLTPWLVRESYVCLLSLGGVFLMLALVARTVKNSWQDGPPSPVRLWFRSTFCQPMFFVGAFNRWLRRKLEKNPIGWLEQRKWSSRVVQWGWLAIMISFYSVVLSNVEFGFRNFSGMQQGLGMGLVLSMALTAAGSFRQERETGVLELLLISPMRVRDIMWGRLRGVWGQFILSILLLVACHLFLFNELQRLRYWERQSYEAIKLITYVVGYLSVPAVGLYFSLCRKHFIAALLWTVLVGIVVPQVLTIYAEILREALDVVKWWWQPALLGPLLQIVLAVWLWRRLYRNLAQRKFVLAR